MPRSRFASLSAPAAWACLAALAALVVWGLLAGGPLVLPVVDPDRGDIALYQAIVGRIRAGEGYYTAAAAELAGRGYAVRPFVNFRLPTVALFTASPVGTAFGTALLIGLALATLVAWIGRLGRGLPAPIALGVPVMTAVGCAWPGVVSLEAMVVFHETWACLLIALSLALWDPKRWWPSMLVGLMALLVRELALPYLAIMAVTAFWEGRRREALAWAGGIALFAVFLAVHAYLATIHTPAVGPTNSWTAVGGWRFVLTTAGWSIPLLLVPAAAHGLLVPVALLGLAGWRGAFGTRVALVVGGYVGALMLVGRPDNHYWGFLYAQLLIPGFLMAVPALRDLLVRALEPFMPRGEGARAS
ncbi:hypothetical protein [Salinarimonas soli]|uniref:DUF2029 domain-containing protein n=1 Tax=Salinarimonas soli TaxID=1638099 RepID=A0A5B2VED1_9HYPH|nr:hypothetical protein [Salinarimonas soli]KAA2236719.1 hypothetical protein F0L46_13200 [Salinarimonas soli]